MTGAREKSTRTRFKSAGAEIAYAALAVALITVCSWISIPVGNIPVTLQTFAVAVIGALLGFKRGTVAVAVYLLMGLIGIPVFSGFRAGVAALLGPTGGYMIGFLFDVLIVGLFSLIPVKNQAAKICIVFGGALLGLLVCYFFGTLWFVTVFNRGSTEPVSVVTALTLCVLPYLIPDAVKLVFASVLGVRLKQRIRLQ